MRIALHSAVDWPLGRLAIAAPFVMAVAFLFSSPQAVRGKRGHYRSKP